MQEEQVLVCRATRTDSRSFLRLLVSLADFEHLEPPDETAKRTIIKDIFEKKRVRLFLAFVGKKAVGYALYFYTYSTFLAKPTLYLEDIFVLEEFRQRGVGRSLFLKCMEEAVREGCGRLELAVLTWNKNAIRFYEKLGAKRLDEWNYYRLTFDTMMKNLSEVVDDSGHPRKR
ncbi:MAG: GNAT family N-acetyltransferase [Nitrososphaerales archaeon]